MTENNDFNNIENDSTNSRNEKRFKLFVENKYGVQTVDGEVIFDSISSMAEADVLVDLLNDLTEENEQLKVKVDFYKYFQKDARELEKENEELKQRNNRQAKQLDRLYNLIEEKDWRTLSDILDDFKRCEEQLQKEWGTYGDVE